MKLLPLKFWLFIFVVFAGPAFGQLYWAGTGLNPATAGGGTWDNANMQWSSTFPIYAAATWDRNIANFNGTGGGAVTLGANINVNDINFGATAGAFALTNSGANQTLSINGAGITNNSANTQSIFNIGLGSSTNFNGSATAGNATITNIVISTSTNFFDSATAGNATIRNVSSSTTTSFSDSATAGNATLINSGPSSAIGFRDNATAGNAIITNSGASSSTIFNDNATAGNATINNSGGNTLFQDNASAGSATITSGNNNITTFRDSATAADATFINSGSFSNANFNDTSTAGNATFTNSGSNSSTAFTGTATAGNATITNSGGVSRAIFFGTATAGNATITNSAATSFTEFNINSSAGSATITNGDFSSTQFFDNATAGNATINNSGANSFTRFDDNTSAGSASINNSGSFSHTNFNNTSTAGSATITSGNNNITVFHDSATAANAIFINSGSFSNAQFFDTATAGNATFTNSGSNSATNFLGTATAGNATITNSGGVSRADFFGSATAGNATITNSGNLSDASFSGNSSGGTATLINANPTAFIDISSLTSAGTFVGSVAGNGFIDLGSKTFTVGGNNMSTTFSGVIQDGGAGGGTGGSLTKTGTGTLILSGANTYTGNTNVDAGVLQLDGSVVSALQVNPGATLSGHGTINNNATNQGLVSPGSPQTAPGTLFVGNSYRQTGTATLRIDIGGLAAGIQSDLLRVGTNAVIDGTLQLGRINNFMPAKGDEVTIVTAGTSRTGEFRTVELTNWGLSLIQPVVQYDRTTQVYVVFELSASFESLATTRNQICVAENLDAAAQLSSPEAVGLVTLVANQSMADLPAIYDLLAPEELASMYEISFSQAQAAGMNFENRMNDIRAGFFGYRAWEGAKQVAEVGGGKGPDSKDKNPAPIAEVCPDKPWDVWATGYGQVTQTHNEDQNAHGYDIDTGGFTTGVDYRFGQNYAVGIGGGFATSSADLVNGGEVDAHTGYAGLYGTAFWSGLYVDAAATGGWTNYDTNRRGLDGFEKGSTDGAEFNGLVTGGYDWKHNCLTIGPFASFQYTYVDFNAFDENGGSAAPLHYFDQSQSSQRSFLGLHLAADCVTHNIIFRPEARIAWQHEFGDTAYQIDWSFRDIADNHICDVFGPSKGRDSALVNAGFSLIFGSCHNVAAYVYYDGNIGAQNWDRHGVTGGLRISF